MSAKGKLNTRLPLTLGLFTLTESEPASDIICKVIPNNANGFPFAWVFIRSFLLLDVLRQIHHKKVGNSYSPQWSVTFTLRDCERETSLHCHQSVRKQAPFRKSQSLTVNNA